MKTATVFASALACAGSALAAPATTYYNLVASASGQAIDGAALKVSGGWWYLGKATTSTCGDVSPAVTVGSAGALSFHADGKQNQQQGFVDISGAADGLLGYTLPDQFTSPSQLADKFSMAGSEQDQIKLFWDGESNWLACPTEAAGQYMIYPAKMYGKAVGKDKCLSFEVKVNQVEAPATVCVYN
ncbi:hypothetical protein BFW01_g3593 [Lasiodiplodia theobromae]|uniref:Cell wall protein n=2 Tax=Lasiodiplodia TaxID=66739 RepID=A0A5N5D642_9PEZI|nr:hypothetical protein DBV05_g8546 [Lasiodiplodia theobromae]KAF9632730.1 hypothetical protein BFW01_g3593 [Lasiodiplodia theobromae]KAK0661306.1 hypothetical protein DIS24_g2500 [Lasiodiplodia hormozganensis]